MATLTETQRAALVYNADFLYANRAHLGYTQVRPLKFYTKVALEAKFKAGMVSEFDCSGSVMEIFYMSGCKDPSGYDFDGYGNSVTMLERLKHYENPVDAHAGALVVFGANLPLGQQHVCMVWKQGKDPTLFSHGEPGVSLIPLSEEIPEHPGAMVTFLDVSPLG